MVEKIAGGLGALLLMATCCPGVSLAAGAEIQARPEPSVGAKPPQTGPAGMAAKRYWDKVLARCGDDAFHYFDRSEIVDYKGPVSFAVHTEPLTDAERQAGYVWKARSTLTAPAWRSRGADDNLHTRGEWSAFVGDADESVSIVMTKAQVLLFEGQPLMQYRKAIACDEALGPAGDSFLAAAKLDVAATGQSR